MYDTCPFEGPVYSYPVSRNGSRFTVKGIFCSLACAKAYVIEREDSYYLSLFYFMCKEVHGITTHIVPAPPWCTLAKFDVEGGISIQTFRSISDKGFRIRVLPKDAVPFEFEKTNLLLEKAVDYLVTTDEGHTPDNPRSYDRELSTNRLEVVTLDRLAQKHQSQGASGTQDPTERKK